MLDTNQVLNRATTPKNCFMWLYCFCIAKNLYCVSLRLFMSQHRARVFKSRRYLRSAVHYYNCGPPGLPPDWPVRSGTQIEQAGRPTLIGENGQSRIWFALKARGLLSCKNTWKMPKLHQAKYYLASKRNWTWEAQQTLKYQETQGGLVPSASLNGMYRKFKGDVLVQLFM